MPFLLALWPIVRPLLPYLIAAAAIGAGWLWLDQRCNAACERKSRQLSAITEQMEQARQRATDLALLWANVLDRADRTAKASKEKADATFAAIADNSRRVASSGSIRISPDALRVWGDASAAANGQAPPAEPDPRPYPVPVPAEGIRVEEAELREKWQEAARAYEDAKSLHRQTVLACEALLSQSPE